VACCRLRLLQEFGLLGIAGRFISRRLQSKAKKHDEIKILAECKLNSMKDLISKALQDGQISEQEFKLILDDVAKYYKMKQNIRLKCSITNIEKKELIQQGKTEALNTIQTTLKGV
jgi:hypothetical protein